MLDHKIISQTESSITFTVKLDEAYIQPHKAHVLEHLKSHLKVSGFRQGKMPDAIAERELGADRVQTEVLQDIIAHSYSEVLTKLKLEVIADPEVSLTKFVPYTELEYKVDVALMPSVKVPSLSTIKVDTKTEKVTDKELEDSLEQLRKNAARHNVVKRASKMGDKVKFDFEGSREGKPVEGAIGNNQVLRLGDGQFIPGFEDNLVGMKAGEEKDFEITFPKDYHAKDLQSAVVNFHIKMIEVAEEEVPELNEDFAKSMGGFTSVEALRDDLKKHLQEGKDEQAEQKVRNDVLEALVNKTKVEVPKSLVSSQTEQLRSQMSAELAQNGLDEEKYLEINNKKKAEYDKELETEAERRVKLGLILRQIVTDQKLKVNDTELELRLGQYAQQYGNDPQIAEQIQNPEFAADLRNRMLSEKAIDYVVGSVKKGGK